MLKIKNEKKILGEFKSGWSKEPSFCFKFCGFVLHSLFNYFNFKDRHFLLFFYFWIIRQLEDKRFEY